MNFYETFVRGAFKRCGMKVNIEVIGSFMKRSCLKERSLMWIRPAGQKKGHGRVEMINFKKL
jgi:hypothetical protein